MLKIKFQAAKNGGVMARIDGRISFPEKKGFQPQPGEEWLVEIIGQNPKGTVNFLRCLAPVGADDPRIYRELGIDEKLGTSMVLFFVSNILVASYKAEDFPELFAEHLQKIREREEMDKREWEKQKAQAEAQATLIRAKINNAKEEVREVNATSYKVEELVDEDWGLHKADSGYSIRVTPIFDRAINYPYRNILEEMAREHYGESEFVSWNDIESAAEDEAMMNINGPNRALIDLADDVINSRYYQLTVCLTEEQIREIDEKYASRFNRHKFNTSLGGFYILKSCLLTGIK